MGNDVHVIVLHEFDRFGRDVRDHVHFTPEQAGPRGAQGATGLDDDECPLADECVVSAIEQAKEAAGDKVQTRWLIGLALLVAFVGILNAMLMSVTERFREIYRERIRSGWHHRRLRSPLANDQYHALHFSDRSDCRKNSQ